MVAQSQKEASVQQIYQKKAFMSKRNQLQTSPLIVPRSGASPYNIQSTNQHHINYLQTKLQT